MDATSTPTFERVLSVFENAAAGEAFEPAYVVILTQLQRAAREHYANILDGMLAHERPAEALSAALINGAQMLHRRIANALAQAALRQTPQPQRAEDETQIAELALASLRARADEIKWHAFEQTTAQRTSWGQTNRLMRYLEAAGLHRRHLAGQATCSDAYAHCILLSTLNVGILNVPQMELAHRWLSASATDMRVEPSFDPEAHWYQIDLARERGPERVAPASASTADTTRFIAVASLGAKLAQARTKLYVGQVSIGITPTRQVALHFGAFLDLAERLWSPDWRRTSLRAEREKTHGESIEVVIGFDNALVALRDEEDPALAQALQTWSLRDRSNSGLGALVASDVGGGVRLGTMIAFRPVGAEQWELGCIVRRIRAAEEDLWRVGIRRLSADPVAIDLSPCGAGPRAATAAAAPAEAIYAPISTDTGRIDGLVIRASAFGAANELMLPTEGGAFRIRANRVIDRGEQWVRLGFEVLGRISTAAPHTIRTGTL